jgi:hypothetical protein
MAITQTGDRNKLAAATRALRVAWFGADSTTTERPPLTLSNEYIVSNNAANTGLVNLIKSDAADSVHLASGRALFNSVPKTIVDGSATSLFDVACAANTVCGGTILYTVTASDGTDFQALTGMVTYAAVNKATAITLTITEATANQAKAVSAGTLTLAWTFVAGTAKGTVKLQPTGSLTETLYTVTYTVIPTIGTSSVTIL